MNRRTFTKYLLAAPIALATLLTSHPTPSVVRKKEESEELGQKTKKFDISYYVCNFDLEPIIWPYTLENLKYI